MKKLFVLAITAVIGLSGVACDNGTTAPVQRAEVTVTVSPTTKSLFVGQTTTLVATLVNDTVGPFSGVTWTSSASGVASVNATSGLVTALTPGTATITAKSNFDATKQASAVITVSQNPTQVTITPSVISVVMGKTQQITAAVTPAGAVTYSSSQTAVATIDANTGLATAVSPGVAVITARSVADTSAKATATMTVTAPTPLTLSILGVGAVNERYTAEVAVKGDIAYTTTWGTRTASGNVVKIWNIAGATPMLVDSLRLAGSTTTSDVQISPDGTLLVVSTEGGSGSIAIYNIANPAAPQLITRYQTAQTQRGVHTVKLGVINGRLYGVLQIDPSNAQLIIVDLSNLGAPQQVASMSYPYVHDVFIRDGLLFVAAWHDGMYIYDIGGGGKGGSPANPVQISNAKTKSGYIHNIWWYHNATGGKKYAFLGEEGPTAGGIGGNGTTSGDIHVMDVSNLNAPVEVAVYTLGAQMGTHNFWVDEQSGVLYAAYYNGGVRAIDVRGDLGSCTVGQRASYTSVSGAPLCDLRLMGREMASGLTTGGFVWGVMMQGTRLYASDMAKGLVVFDITALKR